MSVEVKCENCGELVEKSPCQVSEHNFCSRSCSAEWHSYDRVELTCDWCDDTFQKLESQVRDHNFCSKECNNKWISNQKNMATCEWCGEKFHKPPKEDKEHDFCCHEHYAKWAKGKNTGEDHPRYNQVRVECAWCNKRFTVDAYRTKRNNNFFCTRECYANWLSENHRGEAHPRFKENTVTVYGLNWHKQREKALERDNYRCQLCDTHNDELERELSVHHLKPFRTFRGEKYSGEVEDVEKEFDWKRANRLENLITLCSKCHPKIENNPDLIVSQMED